MRSVPARRAADNPFVPLTLRFRQVFASVVGAYLVITLAAGVWVTGLGVLPLWLALACSMFVRSIPVLFWTKDVGLFHPFVFDAWWGLGIRVVRQTPMFIVGLSAHRALPSYSSSELTGLMAYLILLESLGNASMLFGYRCLPLVPVPIVTTRAARGLAWKLPVLFAVSLGCFLFLSHSAGSIANLMALRSLDRADRVVSEFQGIGTVVMEVLLYGCVTWLAMRPSVIGRPRFWAFLVSALTMEYLATGSRSGVVQPLMLVVCVHALNTRRIPYLRLVVLAFFSITVIGALGMYRTATFGSQAVDGVTFFQRLSIGQAAAAGAQEIVARATSDHGALPVLANVPHNSDLLWGRSYLALLLVPFPSAILPFDKPLQSGRLNGALFFGSTGGVPTGTVGEAYWNFHIPGVILVFLAWGMVNAYVTRLFLLNRQFAAAAPLLVFFILAADFNGTAFAPWVQGTVLMLMVATFFGGVPRLAAWRWSARS